MTNLSYNIGDITGIVQLYEMSDGLCGQYYNIIVIMI